jgi:hypothetical protein
MHLRVLFSTILFVTRGLWERDRGDGRLCSVSPGTAIQGSAKVGRRPLSIQGRIGEARQVRVDTA